MRTHSYRKIIFFFRFRRRSTMKLLENTALENIVTFLKNNAMDFDLDVR